MTAIPIYDYLAARQAVDRDPDIDPNIFWPRIGVNVEAVAAIARDGMKAYPSLTFPAIMSILEVGATLAEAGIRGQKPVSQEEIARRAGLIAGELLDHRPGEASW